MIDQAAFARALLDPALPPPADVCAWNGSDPAARLAVYRNNVMVSLLGVLADTFPVTRELVGDAFFRAMGQRHRLHWQRRSRARWRRRTRRG